jgi:hypothetical protein
MGYIGLLLNAPYKIDSMMGMSLWMILVSYSLFLLFSFLLWARKTRAFWRGGRLKIRATRVLGILRYV